MVVGSRIFGVANVVVGAKGPSVPGVVGKTDMVVGTDVVADDREFWDVNLEDRNWIAVAARAAGSGVLDDSS